MREQNDRLVAENVSLQREAERIPGLKKQLDTYKQAKCDAVSVPDRWVSQAADRTLPSCKAAGGTWWR